MRQLFRFSFYWRIQLSFLLLILLPTLAVSLYSYSLIKDNVTGKIKLSNESVLALMTKDLTKMIDDLTFASNFFVQDLNVRSRLRTFKDVERIETSKDADNYMQIRDFFSLVSAKTMNNDIQMFIANNSGFIIQASDSVIISPEQIVS
ncbi:hypothetical protein ACHHV8_26435 [Paenibacillus sp. TAB 01]|uniref:hypothetical protein n=1 Tax=Paenibacillus sp. TAB 01 TaxID=3368988 RepID=UPI003753D6A4